MFNDNRLGVLNVFYFYKTLKISKLKFEYQINFKSKLKIFIIKNNNTIFYIKNLK